MGRQPARPRGSGVHRPARGQRCRPGGRPRRVRRPPASRRVLRQGHRRGHRAQAGQREPQPRHGRDRDRGLRRRGAQRLRPTAVPHQRRQSSSLRGGGGAPQAPLPRPASQRPQRRAAPAQQGQQGCSRRARRAPVRGGRDADADPFDARGCARLPRAGASAARQLVRTAAEPAALQAAAHGRRHGALLPDRALLPRRGLPRRPAAGVHPARHRDELRRAGRRHRLDGGRAGGDVGAHRRRDPPSDPADDLRGGDASLRLGQARPADGSRAGRVHRLLRRDTVPGVSPRTPSTSGPW